MTLHNRIENLKARAHLYNYVVCPKEQVEEIVAFLETLEEIIDRAKEAEELPSERITLNDYYTEGWQDCLDCLGIDNLFEEGTEE